MDEEIERRVARARDYFDNACEYGSPEYGYPSLLAMLVGYMEDLLRSAGAKTVEELPTGAAQRFHDAETEFRETLEAAMDLPDLPDKARDRIKEAEERYRANIAYGASDTVAYYQERVDLLMQRDDIGGLNIATRGLIFAHIHALREKGDEALWSRRNDADRKSQQRLLASIDRLLDMPARIERYGDYIRRTQLYRHWMELAKVLGEPIDKGLMRAKAWYSMEEERQRDKNPEPYYYYAVMLYLSAIDGSRVALQDLHTLKSHVSMYRQYSRFDSKYGNLQKIRDMFVVGEQMGQLFNVRGCATQDDIVDAMEREGVCPATVRTNFADVKTTLAILKTYIPGEWKDEEITMDMGRTARCAFTPQQLGRRIECMAGFTPERIAALPRYAADIESGESVADVKLRVRKEDRGPVLKMSRSHETNKPAVQGAQRTTAQTAQRQETESSTSKPAPQKRWTAPQEQKHGGLASDRKRNVSPATQQKDAKTVPDATETIGLRTSALYNVTLREVNRQKAHGTASESGREYAVVIPLKNRHDKDTAEAALRSKTSVRVRITAAGKDGKHKARLV